MALPDLSHRLRVVAERLPPPALLMCFYGTFIVVGAILLLMPFAHTDPITISDAIFTAASAVTVTGLIVVDTGSAYTFFGELVIAILIQLGGLGLMTFAVLVLSAMGIHVGLPQQVILREDLNQSSMRDLISLVKIIAMVAFVGETIGAILLSFIFIPEFGFWPGVWQSIFHSISAFNNAGFSLNSDSLMGFVGSPIVNITITLLFIIGGLGFIVLADLREKRSWRALTLHSKLMLVGTLALIVWAFLMFALLEWNNEGTIGALSTVDKLWASWFQAVTPRTAGFNTINTAEMENATAMMTMTLMLVGAGSTSTAGGIKVTTMIVLLLATVAFFRRSSSFHAFGRSLGTDEVMKVMALTTISIITVFAAIFIIAITHDGPFLHLIFEVVSAFGTVGLSMGATGELDGLGRTIIILIMFMGRVGPLTLGFFIARGYRDKVRYPPGKIYLG